MAPEEIFIGLLLAVGIPMLIGFALMAYLSWRYGTPFMGAPAPRNYPPQWAVATPDQG